MPRFKKPGYTQIPNEILDDLMPSLTGAQLKVLLLISRKTLGFHRDCHAMSLSAIRSGTGLSENGVLESVRSLEDSGFIVAEKRFMGDGMRPRATEYYLGIEDDDQHLTECGVANTSQVDSIPQPVRDSIPQPVRDVNKESKETSKENSKTTTLELLDPVDLSDPVEDFVKNAYSRENRAAKIDNLRSKASASLREQLHSAESNVGPEEFRQSLVKYLHSESPWLREHRWPLYAFLKTQDTSRNNGRSKVRTPQTTTPTPPKQPAVCNAQETAFPDEAKTWNRIVEHGTKVELFDWNMEEGEFLNRCRSYEDFGPSWEKICGKIEAILQSENPKAQFLSTFHWIIKERKNWWKVLNGTYDTLIQRPNGKSHVGHDPNAVVDEALRIIRGKRRETGTPREDQTPG